MANNDKYDDSDTCGSCGESLEDCDRMRRENYEERQAKR